MERNSSQKKNKDRADGLRKVNPLQEWEKLRETIDKFKKEHHKIKQPHTDQWRSYS